MDTKTEERRTIKIKLSTYKKLKLEAKEYMETMDAIINRLLFKKKHGKEGKTDFEESVEKLM